MPTAFGMGAAIPKPGNVCPDSMDIAGDAYIGIAGLVLFPLTWPTEPPGLLLLFGFISGIGVFSGSNSFCSAKRHMNASLPELCIVHWTSTLAEERRLPRERVDPGARDCPVLGSCIAPRSPVENNALSKDAVSTISTLCGSSADIVISQGGMIVTGSMHALIFISSSRWRSDERPCPTSTRLLAVVSESGLTRLL
jgi:hypothetical protein